jgi:DNA primase
VELDLDGHAVKLTNLQKLFWPELGITKGDLLRYYLEVSPFLLPHLANRAMVMKRYPNGAAGDFFLPETRAFSPPRMDRDVFDRTLLWQRNRFPNRK